MLQDKLIPFIKKFDEINNILVSQDFSTNIKKMTELSKEQSNLEPIVNVANLYNEVISSIKDNKSLLDDNELGELAKEELKELEIRKNDLEDQIRILLIPKDPYDDKNIYIELVY